VFPLACLGWAACQLLYRNSVWVLCLFLKYYEGGSFTVFTYIASHSPNFIVFDELNSYENDTRVLSTVSLILVVNLNVWFSQLSLHNCIFCQFQIRKSW